MGGAANFGSVRGQEIQSSKEREERVGPWQESLAASSICEGSGRPCLLVPPCGFPLQMGREHQPGFGELGLGLVVMNPIET